MPKLEALERLLILQGIDVELHQLDADIKALIPRLKALDDDAVRRKQALAKLESTGAAKGKQRRALEDELAAAERRRDHARKAGEMARTPKEAEAATHELESAESRIGALEEQILALMEAEEQEAKGLVLQRAVASRNEEKAVAEKSRLSTALDEKRSLAKDLKEERVAAANRVGDDELSNYEWALKHHGKPPAVVPVEAGSCGGCGAVLPPQRATVVRQGDSLEQCDYCRRFLYSS